MPFLTKLQENVSRTTFKNGKIGRIVNFTVRNQRSALFYCQGGYKVWLQAFADVNAALAGRKISKILQRLDMKNYICAHCTLTTKILEYMQ